MLGALDHPGVIRCFDTFEEGKNVHLVLEYALNGDFMSFMRTHKLDYDAKVFYIAQMVSILEYLRSEKVIHRDLKPENLLLDEQWNLKLADFGTA